MTCPEESNTFYDVLKLLTADGFNGLGEAARRLINEAMCLERQNYLGVGPYERNEDRQGYANGYKPKTVKSRLGLLFLRYVTAGFILPLWKRECAPNVQ